LLDILHDFQKQSIIQLMKINWSKALVDYLADETTTYESIAQKYSVSKRAVVTRVKQDNWQELRTRTSLQVTENYQKSLVIALQRSHKNRLM